MQERNVVTIESNIPKVVAFYLPQFHENEVNNRNWGKGFTEWTNVAKAYPNFNGHYQPHVPKDLGFYNLADIDVMSHQADLAKEYGIDAFCFYYYWFDGKIALYKPIRNYLQSDIEFPFCIC